MAKKSIILLAKDVTFKHIPYEMVHMFMAILLAAERQGVQPVITGAAGTFYPEGKVHRMGYAIDVRTLNLKDPRPFVHDVETYLRTVSPYYKVLYGNDKHLDHIHIGFSWYYAREITEGTP